MAITIDMYYLEPNRSRLFIQAAAKLNRTKFSKDLLSFFGCGVGLGPLTRLVFGSDGGDMEISA